MSEAIQQEPVVDETQEKYVRALADLENLRKKKNQQVEEARIRGEEHVASEMLPIIDDFYRAMAEMTKPRARKKDILEGVQLVFNKFCTLLERLEIQGFESEGQQFTYEIMEAIAEVPTKAALPGTVVGEVEKGYTRGGKLLRAAKVAVAIAPPEES